MESILSSVKKMIGIREEETHFDPDIIMHINSVFMILDQLGQGPTSGFAITGSNETWDDYFGENTSNEAVKTYIGQKVKMIFDPPTSSALLDALKGCINEFEWRLSINNKGGRNGS